MAGPSETVVDNRSQRQQVASLLDQHFGIEEISESETQRDDLEAVEEQGETQSLEEAAEEVEVSELEGGEDEEVEEAAESAEEISIDDIKTIADLAKQIEADPEWLYGLTVSLQDGMPGQTVAELKDAYQDAQRVRGLRDQLEKERNEVTREREKVQVQVQEEIQRVSGLSEEFIEAQAEVRAIVKQYAETDWTTAEQEDPGTAALKRQRMNEAYQAALSKAESVKADMQTRTQEMMQGKIRESGQKLREAIPEWEDAKVRSEEFQQISDMLEKYGYSKQEISSVYDHRALRMARDLSKLKTQQQKAEETVKKVRNAPKALRPSAPTSPNSKKTKLRKIMASAAKSNRPRVKSAAVAELLASEGIK